MNQLGKGGAGVILVTKHPVHGKCVSEQQRTEKN